jgi:hypothetical protein
MSPKHLVHTCTKTSFGVSNDALAKLKVSIIRSLVNQARDSYKFLHLFKYGSEFDHLIYRMQKFLPDDLERYATDISRKFQHIVIKVDHG